MIIGTRNQAGIGNLLGKDRRWVEKRIYVAIAEIQAERDAEGIVEGEQDPLSAEYLDDSGKVNTFFAPSVVERLKTTATAHTHAPEGWMPVGRNGRRGISGLLQKSQRWVEKRLPETIAKLQKEMDDEGIPRDQQELLSMDYLGRGGLVGSYYHPRVIERLQEIAKGENKS